VIRGFPYTMYQEVISSSTEQKNNDSICNKQKHGMKSHLHGDDAMRFKTRKLREQWELKPKLHPRLRAVLTAVDAYSMFHFGKQVVVTSLVRKTSKKSVHYWGRGADIRSWIYTPSEVQDIVQFVVENFPYEHARYKSAVFHSVGKGFHIHLQVKGGM